ncbi:MAG TPA: type VI secretion system baseplate subunit TssG [Bryobacteraceae bacterium]
MASAGRSEDTAVAGAAPAPAGEHWPIAETLDREPWSFEFFQAVRLLARMSDKQLVGRYTNPEDEVLRFGANASVAFPASEIQSLDVSEEGPSLMRVNFMGLTGPLGVLPLAYSAMVIDRIRARDYALRDFLDIFNHRMISLFYGAWEKYRFEIPYERGEKDRFSHHVLGLLGLGTPGLQERQDVSDDSLLFYSGLLSAHARSTTGLRQLLMDFFGVPVEVDQFVGAWYPVELDAQCSVGSAETASEQVGFGAMVGDEVWDQQSRVRIRLGPLTLEQYRDFLPGGEAYRYLKALTKFYAGDEFDMEAQLVLKRRETPDCGLDGEVQLGWTSWSHLKEMERDPGETVLEL